MPKSRTCKAFNCSQLANPQGSKPVACKATEFKLSLDDVRQNLAPATIKVEGSDDIEPPVPATKAGDRKRHALAPSNPSGRILPFSVPFARATRRVVKDNEDVPF